MSLRNLAGNEITFSLRQLSGKSCRKTLSSQSTIESLYQLAFSLRDEKYKNATYENYKRAVNLYYQGNKLKNFHSKLTTANIQPGGVIRENLKKWTNGYGVDLATLTIQDPVTLDEITGKPYILEPGCKHVLEKSSLTTWIESLLKKGEDPKCMCCREKIDDKHLDRLVPIRPTPDQSSNAVIAVQAIISIPLSFGFFGQSQEGNANQHSQADQDINLADLIMHFIEEENDDEPRQAPGL